MSEKLKEIQENVFEEFKDVDDKTLSEFIDVFVFHQGTQNVETSKKVTKFLEDIGLEDAYVKYVMDLKTPNSYFPRTSPVQTELIENLKQAFLALAYNRFRNLVND